MACNRIRGKSSRTRSCCAAAWLGERHNENAGISRVMRSERAAVVWRCGRGRAPKPSRLRFHAQGSNFVRNQLARTRYFSGASQLGVACEPGGCGAEKRVHPRRRGRVVTGDAIPYAGAVLLGFGRPNDLHVLLLALARRAANSASTSSLIRPWPACMEARAASTFWRRNAS